MRPLTPIVRALLIITILVFVAEYLLTLQSGNSDLLVRYLALYPFESDLFYPHQILTHIFMHGGLMHIFFNMYGLYLFGSILESRWGGKQFLTYYLICGLGAGVIHAGISAWETQAIKADAEAYLQNPTPEDFSAFLLKYSQENYNNNLDFIEAFGEKPTDSQYLTESTAFVENIYLRKLNTPTVGASGAIFGLLIAFAMLFPNVELMLLIPPIPLKAKYFVLLYAGMEIYAIYQANPADNVAHFAHLGGLVVGFILLRIWQSQGKV
jgi:membrane associated rhomboid family serine protease